MKRKLIYSPVRRSFLKSAEYCYIGQDLVRTLAVWRNMFLSAFQPLPPSNDKCNFARTQSKRTSYVDFVWRNLKTQSFKVCLYILKRDTVLTFIIMACSQFSVRNETNGMKCADAKHENQKTCASKETKISWERERQKERRNQKCRRGSAQRHLRTAKSFFFIICFQFWRMRNTSERDLIFQNVRCCLEEFFLAKCGEKKDWNGEYLRVSRARMTAYRLALLVSSAVAHDIVNYSENDRNERGGRREHGDERKTKW